MMRCNSQRAAGLASRGLTLLEVLAATIMLALLAATCSPIIARAMALMRPSDNQSSDSPLVTVPNLGEIADAFMADPKYFGFANPFLHQIEHAEFACPTTLRAGAPISSPLADRIVRVTRLAAADRNAKHIWLVFECEDCSVVRWAPLPEKLASEQRQGGSP